MKEVVITGLANQIEYATTNGKGLITGKREVITEPAINAVFSHFKTEYERKNEGGKAFGRNYKEHGRLLYLAPDIEVIRKSELESLKASHEDRNKHIDRLNKILSDLKVAYESEDENKLDEFLHGLFTNELADDYQS